LDGKDHRKQKLRYLGRLKVYPILETARTIIRPFTETDTADVFELVKIYDEDASVPIYTKIRTLEDAEKINNDTIKGNTTLVIVSKEPQKPIGWLTFDRAKKAFNMGDIIMYNVLGVYKNGF